MMMQAEVGHFIYNVWASGVRQTGKNPPRQITFALLFFRVTPTPLCDCYFQNVLLLSINSIRFGCTIHFGQALAFNLIDCQLLFSKVVFRLKLIMKIMPLFEFPLCKFKVNSRKMKTNKVTLQFMQISRERIKSIKQNSFFFYLYIWHKRA